MTKIQADPKDMIMVTVNVKSHITHDFTLNDICYLSVSLHLTNLSSQSDFELVLIVKNTKAAEVDKNYLWLGCTQKYVNLKSNHTKIVKFKLGFLGNGLYEIGNISNDSMLKMNLFEATTNLPSDNSSDKLNSLNATSNSNNLETLMESTAISVYLKNSKSTTYELFKILNSFTVCVFN